MDWIQLTQLDQLAQIAENGPALIFKHSTMCSISSMAKRQFEMESHLLPDTLPCYLLDLIAHRDVSNAIAQKWEVTHQSPQLLLVHNTHCLFHSSHSDIDASIAARHLA